MLSRLLVLACASTVLLAGEAGSGAPADPTSAPWTLSFTTQVRGKDRQFVTCQDRTYILVAIEELASGWADGQDIAVIGKLRKLAGGRFGLYRVDNLVIEAGGDALAGKVDGDNVHLVGSIRLTETGRTMLVRHATIAASDAALLQARLAGIGDDDWDRRLGAVNWCRDQARTAGNADFWTATADSLLVAIIEDLAKKAAERKDVALIVRALDLALNQLHDQGLAARTCSPAWIREHGGPQAEQLARRLRGLGYAIYRDQWMPRAQALEREYEDRFAALSWKDAEGFYRLGRWADENAEQLPRARERSWRCYQAGFSADPSHPGLARELGLQAKAPAAGPASAGPATVATDFLDLESGLRVTAPAGWRRGQATNGGAAVSWTDPNSETAYVTVRVLHAPVDQIAQWSVLNEAARAAKGYVEVQATEDNASDRKISTLKYLWTEGEQQRFHSVVLVTLGPDAPAAVLEAYGLPAEQPTLDATLAACASGTIYKAP